MLPYALQLINCHFIRNPILTNICTSFAGLEDPLATKLLGSTCFLLSSKLNKVETYALV